MGKLVNKNILKVLLMVAIVLVFTACSSSSDSANNNEADGESGKEEKVKLKFYAQYSDPDDAVYDAAVEAMKEVMPNVEVEFEVAAQDDEQKIKTLAAAGSLPDIFFASSGLIDTFRDADKIATLDDVVEKHHIEDQLNESSKPMLWNEDGHSYAVPNVGQWAGVIYYNKELFEEYDIKVPENFDEFLTMVQTFSENDILPLSLFGQEKWPGVLLYDMAAVGEEHEGLKKLDNGNGDFSEEAYVNAANKLAQLRDAGLLSKNVFNTSADDAYAQFTAGKAAMYISGAWSASGLYDIMGDKVDILYTPLADADIAEDVKWHVSGGGYNQGFAVSKDSEHLEIAKEYAALYSLEFAKQRVKILGDPNPILAEEVQPDNGYNPIQEKYAEDSVKFETMTTFAWGYSNAKFKTYIEDNVEKLLAGQSPEEFIATMNKDLENARK